MKPPDPIVQAHFTFGMCFLLSRKVLEKLIETDVVGVCVTFIDELTRLGPQTVSVASTVTPEDPTRRTFKIRRKPADGLAYALSIAQRYALDQDKLSQRLESK